MPWGLLFLLLVLATLLALEIFHWIMVPAQNWVVAYFTREAKQ
jgi:hypothetical protein